VPPSRPALESILRQSRRLATTVDRLSTLVADVGPLCWVADRSAAALHQFDGYDLEPPFHLVTLRSRRTTRPGHVLHTTTVLPLIDRTVVAGVPVTSPTRTIIDLATHLDAAALTIAVDSALRDGLTSDDFLHRRLVALRSKGRYGIPKLLAVVAGAEIARGGHSWLEREFLRLMAQAQLPAPLTQQVLARRGTRLVRVDCRFADTPVVVELLGYRFHRSPQQMRVDAERANQLLLAGFLPFQFTYLQVVEEPAMVVATVAAALGIHRTLPITPISAS
jgi:hypothetical protein